MGTRGTYGFRYKGRDIVTYNHFDSYPESLGETVLKDVKELIEKYGLDGLREKVEKITFIDSTRKPTDEEKKQLQPYTDTSVSTQSTDDWYCLTREMQGDIKAMVEVGLTIDSHEFLVDSLFCEYAYIVNIDDGVLEVYKGFNKDRKAAGRYAKSRCPQRYKGEKRKYWGVALIASIPLDKLPKSIVDALPSEEEEGAEV